ncbi:MAG: hypothetical protein ISN64_02990, partial [Rickettsia sp.]|nr:hypothetical protein [Rickettsia sp.]
MPGFEAFSGKKTGDKFSFENGIKHRIVHADKNAKFSFTIYHRKDTLNVDDNGLIYQSKVATGHYFMEIINLQTGETIRKALHPKGMPYLISKIDPNPELKDTHQINLLLQTGRGDQIEGITILSKDGKELNIMQKIFQNKLNAGELYNIFSMNGACSDFVVQVLTKIVKEKNEKLPEGEKLDIENFKTAKQNGKTETLAETAYNNALSSAQNAHNEEQSNTSNNTDSMIGRVTNHISDSSYEGLGNSILRFFQDNLVTFNSANTFISNSANIYHSKEDSQDPTSDLALIGENGENH